MSEANRDLPPGEYAIVSALEVLTEVLGEIRDSLRAVLWTCGCGHVNGPSLTNCARCDRRPGDR